MFSVQRQTCIWCLCYIVAQSLVWGEDVIAFRARDRERERERETGMELQSPNLINKHDWLTLYGTKLHLGLWVHTSEEAKTEIMFSSKKFFALASFNLGSFRGETRMRKRGENEAKCKVFIWFDCKAVFSFSHKTSPYLFFYGARWERLRVMGEKYCCCIW